MRYDGRSERATRNHVIFREVNERIREVSEVFAPSTDLPFAIVCECADGTCVEQLVIELQEYEAVRAHPHRYLVAPAHATAFLGRVVAQNDGWVVVEDPLPVDGGG